jgi:hypothetical protein
MKPEGILEGEVNFGRPIPEGETISYEFTMRSFLPFQRGAEVKAVSEPLKGTTR